MDKEWLFHGEGEILNDFKPTPKTQCLAAINEYEKKYDEKTAEELFTVILKIIHMGETINYFKEDRTLEGIMNISIVLDEIQNILDFWVHIHKTISNNNYSAE
jgi:hypothetical protein